MSSCLEREWSSKGLVSGYLGKPLKCGKRIPAERKESKKSMIFIFVLFD